MQHQVQVVGHETIDRYCTSVRLRCRFEHLNQDLYKLCILKARLPISKRDRKRNKYLALIARSRQTMLLLPYMFAPSVQDPFSHVFTYGSRTRKEPAPDSDPGVRLQRQ